MPTFDVPTDGGIYRVEATSPKEAYERYMQGQGTLLPPVVPRPGPGENPVLAPPQPPAPSGGTVYVPPEPPAPPPERPLLAPVYDIIGETIAPVVANVTKKGVLPTIGSVAMDVGGPRLPYVGPALAALPPEARQGIGSMLGTGANMLLGIEEPSMQQLALSAVTPGASVRGARAMTSTLPGVQAARATEFVEQAQHLPQIISQGVTPQAVEPLFTQARQLNPPIPMGATRQMVQQLLAHEQTDVEVPSLQFGTVRNLAQQIDQSIGRRVPQGGTPLAQLDAWRQRVGALINVTENTEEQRAYRALYGSILTDLEQAANGLPTDAATMLRQGIDQQRRVYSAQDLGNIVEVNLSKPRPGDNLRTVNTGGILQALEHPRTEQQTMLSDFLAQHPEEREQIIDTLTDMNRRNVKLLPPPGVMFGSGAVAGRAGAAYMGAKAINTVAGSEVIDPQTAAAFGAAGSIALSRALLTPAGRSFLHQMYAETGTINVAQLLAQFGGQTLRASLGEQPISQGADLLHRVTGFPPR